MTLKGLSRAAAIIARRHLGVLYRAAGLLAADDGGVLRAGVVRRPYAAAALVSLHSVITGRCEHVRLEPVTQPAHLGGETVAYLCLDCDQQVDSDPGKPGIMIIALEPKSRGYGRRRYIPLPKLPGARLATAPPSWPRDMAPEVRATAERIDALIAEYDTASPDLQTAIRAELRMMQADPDDPQPAGGLAGRRRPIKLSQDDDPDPCELCGWTGVHARSCARSEWHP